MHANVKKKDNEQLQSVDDSERSLNDSFYTNIRRKWECDWRLSNAIHTQNQKLLKLKKQPNMKIRTRGAILC